MNVIQYVKKIAHVKGVFSNDYVSGVQLFIFMLYKVGDHMYT